MVSIITILLEHMVRITNILLDNGVNITSSLLDYMVSIITILLEYMVRITNILLDCMMLRVLYAILKGCDFIIKLMANIVVGVSLRFFSNIHHLILKASPH